MYLTGASSGEQRNLMPTYALQWAAMRMAKAAGCETYDLYGCPPAADESHPMFGLFQFKTGFSPSVTERWGTWDAPLDRLSYAGVRRGRAPQDVVVPRRAEAARAAGAPAEKGTAWGTSPRRTSTATSAARSTG